MLDQDNKWKDRFNETSLDGEEWLKASDHVLENIIQQIEEKPNRKIPFWIWLIGLGALLCLSVIIMSSSKLSSEAQISKAPESQKLQIIPSDNSTAAESTLEEYTESKDVNGRDGYKSTPIIPEKDEAVAQEPGNLNRASQQKTIYKSSASYGTIKRTSSNTSSPTVKENAYSTIPAERLEEENKTFDLPSNRLNNLSAAKKIESLEPTLPDKQSSLINPEFAFAEDIEPSVNKRNIALGIFLGSSLWDFNLNSNYSTALDPADFRHDNGKALSFGLELMYEINSRLSVFGQIGIENVVFHSGHNSGLSYDSANEINNAPYNHYDLLMASPVGFMNSSISVQRNTVDELPATDIVVDLNSTHRITNIDMGIALSLNVLKTPAFNLNVDFMGGINNFSSVRNSLENFTVNNSSLQAFGGMVDSSQERIDDMTPYAGLGVRAMRQLNREYTISLSLGYKSNLEPIYSENDFSTTIQRIQGSLHLAKKF
jgi:hypothetical protein